MDGAVSSRVEVAGGSHVTTVATTSMATAGAPTPTPGPEHRSLEQLSAQYSKLDHELYELIFEQSRLQDELTELSVDVDKTDGVMDKDMEKCAMDKVARLNELHGLIRSARSTVLDAKVALSARHDGGMDPPPGWYAAQEVATAAAEDTGAAAPTSSATTQPPSGPVHDRSVDQDACDAADISEAAALVPTS